MASKIELICGDCLVEMKKIPNKSIDLVLTDPPYNASNSHIGFKDGYKTIDEEWDKNFDPYPFLDIAFEKIRDGGGDTCFLFLSFAWKVFNLLEKGSTNYSLGAYNSYASNSESLHTRY